MDSFQEFLRRGTIEDCWELVPSTHKAALLNASQTSGAVHLNNIANPTETTISPKSPTPSATLLQKSPRASQAITKKNLIPPAQLQPTAEILLSTPNNSIVVGLVAQTKCDDPKRIQRLVQAVEALKLAAPLPPESYEKLWSAREGLFAGNETGLEGWMCRLVRGRKKIDESLQASDCASRLSLMLIPQFVDYAEKWGGLSPKSGKSGYGRRSLAMEVAAQACGVSLDTLKQYIARTRNYFYLLQKVGPGYVLELGSGVTSL